MGFKLKDELELTIYFNGEEYPLDSGNSFNELRLSESTKLILPTLYLNIVDSANTLLDKGFLDGTIIKLCILSKGKVLQELEFVLYSYRVSYNGGAYSYEIDAYLNVPKYWCGVLMNPLQGSSSSIMQQIAQNCGLVYEGDVSQDRRSVCSLNTPYWQLARKVCNTAWGGNQACFHHGVTLDKVLRFKNIMRISKVTKTLKAFNAPEGKDELSISSYFCTSNSGSLNRAGGYREILVIQSVVENPEVIKEISIKTDSNNPDVSASIRDQIQRGYIRFSPISCSLGDNNLNKGKYYSGRIDKIFSYDISMQGTEPTKLALFDLVDFVAKGKDETPDSVVSGKYILTGKTITIQGAVYSETYFATRMGTNYKSKEK